MFDYWFHRILLFVAYPNAELNIFCGKKYSKIHSTSDPFKTTYIEIFLSVQFQTVVVPSWNEIPKVCFSSCVLSMLFSDNGARHKHTMNCAFIFWVSMSYTFNKEIKTHLFLFFIVIFFTLAWPPVCVHTHIRPKRNLILTVCLSSTNIIGVNKSQYWHCFGSKVSHLEGSAATQQDISEYYHNEAFISTMIRFQQHKIIPCEHFCVLNERTYQ